MSDLKKCIAKRKKTGKDFAEGFEEGYGQFKIGVVLRQARESAGLTQEESATRLKTKKTALSRSENHAEDMKLSTLDRVAKARGRRLEVNIAEKTPEVVVAPPPAGRRSISSP
jgi:transcriptional regulator with XRE-family HTH domain